MTRGAVLLLLLPLLAAQSPAPKLDPLAGRIAGRPQQCLPLQQIGGPDIVDARTILYRQGGRRIWRVSPVGHCPGLRPFTRLIVDLYGTRICRNDRFRTLDVNSTIPGPYCRFGNFTPYDRPSAD